MAFQQPVRVYANVLKQTSSQTRSVPNKYINNQAMQMPLVDENVGVSVTPGSREIVVSAVGVVTAPPDRCRVMIRVTSKKEKVQDAKNSVSRRLDYIVQTLQNHAVKEKDMPIFKHLTRHDSLYLLVAELRATFSDFDKCEKISNLLVEKLDENVSVSLPEFFHASTAMESLRKQASLLAVHNAKQKAQEMARFVHLAVGRPLYIHEEETKEWEGPREGEGGNSDALDSVHDNLSQATLTVSCRVTAAFQLKPKSKTKVSAR